MKPDEDKAYNLEALWSAVKQCRDDLAAAQSSKREADSRANSAQCALDSATKQDANLRAALVAVLDGKAEVQWHDGNKSFRVKYQDDKMDLWIPKIRSEQPVRGIVTPPNAANVGSSVQGQTA